MNHTSAAVAARASGFALALLFALAAPARADDDAAAREADMFGDAPATDATSAEPATTSDGGRDDAIFGASEPSSSASASSSSGADQLLAEAAEYLDLGGQLFLRMNGTWREEQGVRDIAPSMPSLIDFYADVRPNDRLRGFAQARLTFDPTVQEGDKNLFGQEQKPLNLLLDQAWVKFDLGRVAYFTVGRQRIRWGTGRFFNPTDFVNQDIRNSVDFFDARTGVDLVKVHFPFEALGWNLYLLAQLNGLDVLDDTGVGARVETLFGETELSLSSLVRKDQPLRFGADVSTGVWLFDLHAEATVQRGLNRKRFKGTLDFDNNELPEEIDSKKLDETWFFQGVVGGDVSIKYSDQDTLILGGEYFYNQTGYDSAKLYPWLALNGAFVPFYLGQHYAAAYAVAQSPLMLDDLSLTASLLTNLSDLSFLTRLDVQYRLLTYLTLNGFVGYHFGKPGEFHLGIEVPPLPLVPGLENGIDIQPEILDVGVAARIAF